MPSRDIAIEIADKKVYGEATADAEFLFDALLDLRAGVALTSEANERVTGALLCFLLPSKPAPYVNDMQRFRMSFAGVAADATLQSKFRASVLGPAVTLLVVDEKDESMWDANRYFVLRATASGAGFLMAR